MKNAIRQIYFYTATLIFLIMSVVALISLLNLGLKTYVFTKADTAYDGCAITAPSAPGGEMRPPSPEALTQQALCEQDRITQREAQRQDTLVQYLSMLVVAAPLFFLHFKWVQKERGAEIARVKDEK